MYRYRIRIVLLVTSTIGVWGHHTNEGGPAAWIVHPYINMMTCATGAPPKLAPNSRSKSSQNTANNYIFSNKKVTIHQRILGVALSPQVLLRSSDEKVPIRHAPIIKALRVQQSLKQDKGVRTSLQLQAHAIRDCKVFPFKNDSELHWGLNTTLDWSSICTKSDKHMSKLN